MDSEVTQTLLIEIQLDDKSAAAVNSLKGTLKGVKETGDAASQSGENLTQSIIKGGIALKILQKGFQALSGFTRDVFQMGSEFTRLDTSLSVVARNMGITQDQLKGMKEQLAEVNTWGSKADTVLLQLARSGLLDVVKGMQFANGEQGLGGLVLGFKDLAAVAGVSSSEGIKRLTKFIQTGNQSFADGIMEVGNLNAIYKEFAGTVGKSVTDLSEQERAFARLQATMGQAQLAVGAYDATNQTAAKNMLSMTDAMDSIKELLGSALEPLFRSFTKMALGGMVDVREVIISSFQKIQVWGATVGAIFTKIVGGITNFIKAYGKIIGIGTAVVLVIAASVKAAVVMVNAYTAATKVLAMFSGVQGLTSKGAITMAKSLGISSVSMLGVAATAAIAIAALLALVAVFAYFYVKNIKVNDSLLDMGGLFDDVGNAGQKSQNKIADSAKKAAEAIADVRKQIDEENRAFEEQLGTIVKSARDRIKENRSALDKEKADYDKAFEDRKSKYEEDKDAQEKQNEGKLSGLEILLEQTKALDEADAASKMESIQAAIDAEKIAGEEKLTTITEQFNEETAQAEEAYAEKTNKLQEQLDTDMTMLESHAADIVNLQEVIAKDEITILKEKHQERLDALNETLEKEKKAQGAANDSMVGDFDASFAEMDKILEGFGDGIDWGQIVQLPSLGDVLLDVANFFTTGLTGIISGLFIMIAKGLGAVGKAMQWIGEKLGIQRLIDDGSAVAASADSEAMWNTASDIAGAGDLTGSGFERKASGGKIRSDLTMVGEHGIEILANQKGSQVLNNRDTKELLGGSGGDTIVNINGDIYGMDDFEQKVSKAVESISDEKNRLSELNVNYG